MVDTDPTVVTAHNPEAMDFASLQEIIDSVVEGPGAKRIEGTPDDTRDFKLELTVGGSEPADLEALDRLADQVSRVCTLIGTEERDSYTVKLFKDGAKAPDDPEAAIAHVISDNVHNGHVIQVAIDIPRQ